MKVVSLSECCEIIMGQAPVGESYNLLNDGYALIAGAGDFGADVPEPKKFTTSPTRLSEIGDIILCIRATIGDLNWSDKVYCLGRGVASIRAKPEKAHPPYIWHILLSKKAELARRGTGSTFKQISRSVIEDLKIPLPPLLEQKRIAAILDKADAIRRKREKAIELTDSFLRSVFLEMFGDPRTNPRGWDSDLLGNLARFMGGGTPTTSEERYWNGDIPWVSPKDMKATFISNSIDKITKVAVEQSATQLIPQGSVLVVNRSGILKKKLPLGINSVPVAINQDLKAMVPSSRLLSNFLLFQLMILSPTILKTVRATTADNIGTDVFKKLSLLVPPIEKQALFSQVVERHRQLCEKLVLSLTSIETLTGSLSQRLFNLPKEQTKISSMQSQEVAHAL